MYQGSKELLIIDDDCCHNIACALTLKKALRYSDVNMIGFTNSKEGISYITQSFEIAPKEIILFLDINMLHLNGWVVLKQLEQLPNAIKKHLEVYVVTAFPNYHDEQRALSNPLVKQYLERPLSNHLHSIFASHTLRLSVA